MTPDSLWVFVFRHKENAVMGKKGSGDVSPPSRTLTPALSQARPQGVGQAQGQPVARKVPAQVSVPAHPHGEDFRTPDSSW